MFSPIFTKIAEKPCFLRVMYQDATPKNPKLDGDFSNLTLRKKEEDKNLNPFNVARTFTGNAGVLEGAPARKLLIAIQPAELGPVVESIEEAEEMVFAIANQPTMTFYPPNPNHGSPFFVGDACAAFPVMINRCANLIATRTRRGAGNKVFMHPKNLRWLIEASTSAFKEAAVTDAEKIGLWTPVGKLNNVIEVYVADHFPEDRATVMYWGNEYDAPAQLVNVGNKTHIVMMENHPEALGNAVDYLCSVTIGPEHIYQ